MVDKNFLLDFYGYWCFSNHKFSVRGFGFTASLAFYGFETNEPLSFTGLLIITVAMFKAVTAFSLWFEKDYAVALGKTDAIIGMGLCLVSMLVLPFLLQDYHVTLRLELALLIPYLIKLDKINAGWKK